MKNKIIVFLCLAMLAGCSTKRDSFKNRTFHRATSWFNILFNAEKEMDKKLTNLEFEYRDNYSEILPVDPRPEVKGFEFSEEYINRMGSTIAPGRGNSNTSLEGFDLVEQKALKAIEKHSMLINGVERNKAMTHAYLVLGKARYNKGMSFESLEALNYLSKKLPYHKKYTPEAQLYIALANLQVGNVYDGEHVLVMLYKDDGYKKAFKENISKNYAQLLIRQGNYEEAIKVLDNTIKITKNKKRKARYYFIEAQLYSLMGMQNEAGAAYAKVYSLKPGFEMEVKSQLGIAANFNPEKNSYASYKSHLLDVAKKGNYVSRKNELYYAIGDIAIKDGKLNEARHYLKESFIGAPSDPYVRGRAYERYADLEFDEGNYVFASAYYDSALAVAPYSKDIDRITRRNTSLKKLMEKHYLVKRNDSILMLAQMDLPEQENFFNNYISKLKIEDAKKKQKMEEEATLFQMDTKGGGFDSSFGEGKGGNFYFYNTSAKANGKNEFQKVWGKVRLVDNWRTSSNTGMSLEEKEAEMLGQTDTQNPRRYELEFYIEQIPTSASELNRLKIERDTTELSLGIGYYDLFQNSKLATNTLEHLISTPPKDEITKVQAYYQLYRINLKAENPEKTEEYKNYILTHYPNSIYAKYILNPDVNYITPTTQEALALYEETYDLYKEENFDQARANIHFAVENYSSELIMAKFSLLNALIIGKTEGKENFMEALQLITVAYQNTEEARKAQEILDLLYGKRTTETQSKGDEKLKSGDESKGKDIPEDMELKEKELERLKKEELLKGSESVNNAPGVKPNPSGVKKPEQGSKPRK
ncbi:MAG: tetratricopeptide repeat protein [Weeksellaceae bacterium]|nr:tetratricopeptide repeat protein [Weeksellaceae bacterium]